MIRNLGWGLVGVLAILVGVYPVSYFVADMSGGLLGSKSEELLNSLIWNFGFYGHIVFGGMALAMGWLQFSKKLRKTKMYVHRTVGKIYVLSVLISGVCGIYIGFFATGGVVASTGFVLLGMVWLSTTLMAYRYAKSRRISDHEVMMYFSYAACFAAVTLRIWLPILSACFGEFLVAYRIVAWLCWVPNLVVAYFLLPGKSRQYSM